MTRLRHLVAALPLALALVAATPAANAQSGQGGGPAADCPRAGQIADCPGAQQGGGPTMQGGGGHMMQGWHGGHGRGDGWWHPARGVLGLVLMAAAIAALVALTRYLWRLGDRPKGE